LFFSQFRKFWTLQTLVKFLYRKTIMARHRTPSAARWRLVSKSFPNWLIALALALLFLFFSATVAYSAYKAHRRRPPDQCISPGSKIRQRRYYHLAHLPGLYALLCAISSEGAEEWQEVGWGVTPVWHGGTLHEVTLET
jgi:hypothetical protein